jgi:glutamyl-tRNA reductase
LELSVLGFNHKSAPLELREKLAVLPAPELLAALKGAGASEAVLVSTCNRFEVYVAGGSARAALPLLESKAGLPLAAHCYERSGPEMARHLFEVAAGLDSLVVGETEILGQVKAAYEAALGAGMTGKALNVLFQRALYVGKLVRSETAIAVGQTSVASVAVQLAQSIFGRLSESEILVLGAGAMAEACARHLSGRGVRRLTVANRTLENAKALAERLRPAAVEVSAWEDFPSRLSRVDVVIASTGSPAAVLTKELIESALPDRRGRSLFVIDIAVPRDVEEAVHGLEHVYLYRLEDLETIVAENLGTRGQEIAKAREIVHGKAAEFAGWIESVIAGRETSFKHAEP